MWIGMISMIYIGYVGLNLIKWNIGLGSLCVSILTLHVWNPYVHFKFS